MKEAEIKQTLIDRFEYSKNSAGAVASRILAMDADTFAALKLFFETGKLDQSLSCGEYSVATLIEDYDLKPPAAYLAISDLKKDYAAMSSLLRDGIK